MAGESLAEPIRRVDAALAEARASVDVLERHRPGPLGSAWRDALAADAEAHAAGQTPPQWAAADLLHGDAQRWATARVLCGAVAPTVRAADADLNRDRVRKAFSPLAAGIAARFAVAVATGWKYRQTPAKAWAERTRAEELLAEYRDLQRVVDWANGTQGDGDVPGGPETRGHWICLDLALHPNKRLLSVPQDVVWPEGTEALLGHAVPAGGFAALRESGVHARVED